MAGCAISWAHLSRLTETLRFLAPNFIVFNFLKLEDNIKLDTTEYVTGLDSSGSDRDQCRDLVNTIISHRVP
jgi:hypothetical protein